MMRTTSEPVVTELGITPSVELRASEISTRASGVLERLLDPTAFVPLGEFLDRDSNYVGLEGRIALLKIIDVHERIHRHYRPGLEWDKSPSDQLGIPSEPSRTDDQIRWSAERNVTVQFFTQDQFDDLSAVIGTDVFVRDRLGLGYKFSKSDNVPEEWNAFKKKGFYQEDKQHWETQSFLIIQDAAFLPDVIALSGLSNIAPVHRTHEVYSSCRYDPDAAIPLPQILVNLPSSDAIAQTFVERLIEHGRKIIAPHSYALEQHYRTVSAQVIFSQGCELPISFSESREIRNDYLSVKSNGNSRRGLSREAAAFENMHGSAALERELRDAKFGRGRLAGKTGNVFSDDPFFNPWAPGGSFNGGKKEK